MLIYLEVQLKKVTLYMLDLQVQEVLSIMMK